MVSSPRRRELLQAAAAPPGEKQALGAAVVGIGTPLDQAAVAQLVEQPGQRDRLQIEHFGEFGLVEAFGTVEPDQHGPLRPGHAELRRA